MKKNLTLAAGLFLLANVYSCKQKSISFDASGSFETNETIISAEGNGTLKSFSLEEGQSLKAGEVIGYIDTLQLHLKRKQLLTQINAVESRKPNIGVQLAALEEQLETSEREKKRISNLVKSEAVSAKQLDDINANIEIIKKQIEAQRSALGISSESLNKETEPLKVQIEQLNDLINKCRIVNPVQGTVMAKYSQVNELTAAGKPLYKIANLETIYLRAYISGSQLPKVKLGQLVKVNTDNGDGGYNVTQGTITWINDKAEFTPKTIQTKDERANMVYAIKVKVKNNGLYKIGMYGEVVF